MIHINWLLPSWIQMFCMLFSQDLQLHTHSMNKSPVSLSMNSSVASELNFMSISQVIMKVFGNMYKGNGCEEQY